MLPILHLVQTVNRPIYEQLQLEEALLRTDNRNWCLINQGTPPAIVMGISGKPEHLIDAKIMQQRPIPLIRRFSGGGTVIVDEDTYFLTYICQNQILENVNPQQIMRWTESLYRPVFENHDFSLIDNDYVLGSKKFGGNAQYICKERWLHHTSFLWDYTDLNMKYLLMPKKTPNYREGRAHADFLCRLSDFLPSRETLLDKLIHVLRENFIVRETSWEEAEKTLEQPHRKATILVDFP